MALIVMKPLVERRYLKKADPSSETWVEIRQARQHEELMYAERTALSRKFGDDGSTTLEGGMTIPEIRALECWLTFKNSNIQYQEGPKAKPKPLFTPEMAESFETFKAAFGKLGPEVVIEWQDECWWVNPDWSPVGHPSRKADAPGESASGKPSEST
jgi:hypothetical protein